MIPVYWWSPSTDAPNRGYWAQAILDDVFSGNLRLPENRYTLDQYMGKPYDVDGCVLVLPGRFDTPERFQEVQDVINTMRWVIIYYTADEDQVSEWWNLRHPNMFQFVQAFKTDVDTPNQWEGIPFSYTTDAREALRAIGYRSMSNRQFDWSFAGQITHDRRFKMKELYETVPNGASVWTQGFSQGLPRDEYFELLMNSKVVPAPGGPVTPDSFRMFEALEAGCVPVVDHLSGIGEGAGYWETMFGAAPFFYTDDWSEVYSGNLTWDSMIHQNFWHDFKTRHVAKLHETIHNLSGLPFETVEPLSVIITAAPSFRHPSTAMIEEVVSSIRFHHPTAPIFITNDGVPSKFEHYREQYEEYLRRTVWLANHEWTNVSVITHDHHVHQTGTTRSALARVSTPTTLVIEHDMALTDQEFHWQPSIDLVSSRTYNLIRYQIVHETHPAHFHMMMGVRFEKNGVPVWKTTQWSQRPFLVNTAYYREMAEAHFPEGTIDYVENRMHGPVAGNSWADHRLVLFHPDTSILRGYHLDGRGPDEAVT